MTPVDLPARILRRSGWPLLHFTQTTSTNDVARRLRDGGLTTRCCVLADLQTQGRGREGRAFLSPHGGLYVSLLIHVRAEDLPGGAVALAAVSAAQAIESCAGVPVQIKWPNDVWIGRRKVGGILVEAAGSDRPIVMGIGINLQAVPPGLAPSEAFTALEEEAGRPVDREELLVALLGAVQRWQGEREESGGRAALAAAWKARLLFLGERVRFRDAGRESVAVLCNADLDRGLELQEDGASPSWRDAAYVQDLRPHGHTMEPARPLGPKDGASGGSGGSPQR